MTNVELLQLRLGNQQLSQHAFEKPDEVVGWLGAVQAQDYAAAKWAVGLRLHNTTDEAIEEAFTSGAILRTHVMRPTWHFVLPADIRWLLALTAPRLLALNASYYRKLELDDATCIRCNAVLAKALEGGKQLTRPELMSVLRQAGMATDDLLRGTYIMMWAELDGIVCSGARRGKQFTYALLDERVPQANTFTRNEALAELTRRYFTSHGPATLQDFVWWSGLTVADAKIGLEMITPQLLHEVVDGQTYWFSRSAPPASPANESLTTYLLPNFDEYTVGYTDRSAVIDDAHISKLDSRGGVLNNTIVMNGQVVGSWKRTIKKDTVEIIPNLFTSLNENEVRSFAEAVQRYGVFLGRMVDITFDGR